jgi:hypothetical protein
MLERDNSTVEIAGPSIVKVHTSQDKYERLAAAWHTGRRFMILSMPPEAAGRKDLYVAY